MNAHKVDYNMELYVPELMFYKEHNIFTDQEMEKIVKLREKFEKSICESFCPRLTDFTGYLEHLEATRRLVENRLRNNVAENVSREELNPAFGIINEQVHRVANEMLRLHTENKKTYTWLFRYCVQSSQEQLGLIVAKKLTQLYPGYFLGWVFLAKVLEVEAGVIEARRTYFLGLQNLRETCHNYSQYQIETINGMNNDLVNTDIHKKHIYVKDSGKYAGDALEKDELIREKLPDDGFVILYNWYILELQLVFDMGYVALSEQEFVFDTIQSKEEAIELLIGGYYLALVVTKAIELIARFTTQTCPWEIIKHDTFFSTFLENLQKIHASEPFTHKLSFTVEDIVSRAMCMIVGEQAESNEEPIEREEFNTMDELLATDD